MYTFFFSVVAVDIFLDCTVGSKGHHCHVERKREKQADLLEIYSKTSIF